MIFYKCLKDKAMNIEINQYSYLSPKNNKQKGTILRRQHLKWFLFLYEPYNHLFFLHYSFSYMIKLKYKEEGAPYVESTTS